jgi:hypothetical protein
MKRNQSSARDNLRRQPAAPSQPKSRIRWLPIVAAAILAAGCQPTEKYVHLRNETARTIRVNLFYDGFEHKYPGVIPPGEFDRIHGQRSCGPFRIEVFEVDGSPAKNIAPLPNQICPNKNIVIKNRKPN